MKNLLAKSAIAAIVIAATTGGSMAGGIFGGAYGNYYFSDGSRQFNERAVAGAAPNAYATFVEGVRCSYQYRVHNGQRIRYEVCN